MDGRTDVNQYTPPFLKAGGGGGGGGGGGDFQVVINLHTKYDHSSLMVVEKSLMKTFIFQSMEGKKIG